MTACHMTATRMMLRSVTMGVGTWVTLRAAIPDAERRTAPVGAGAVLDFPSLPFKRRSQVDCIARSTITGEQIS